MITKLIALIIIFLIPAITFSQECPVKENNELVKKHRIKTISVRLKSFEDWQKYDSVEVIRMEFGEDGRILREKIYELFDATFYSLEYKYAYNNSGQLLSKTGYTVYYPYRKRDSSYLNIVGYKPEIQKWTYEYDDSGKLTFEYKYSNAGDSLPVNSVEYHYNSEGQKNKAIFSLVNMPLSTTSSNRTEFYKYDNSGNLIEINAKMTNMDYNLLQTYKYDSEGNKIKYINQNGKTYNYIYEDNKLMTIEEINKDDSEWRIKKTYSYDELGCKTRQTTTVHSGAEWFEDYECNDKGLLSAEHWYTGKNGKKAFSFITEYTYF